MVNLIINQLLLINLNIIEDAKRIIKSVDEKILIVEKKVKNVYRYIYYLENLDCANCASKIERICSRNIDCEQVIIDFATLKIVIESTKNYEEDELQLLIQGMCQKWLILEMILKKL